MIKLRQSPSSHLELISASHIVIVASSLSHHLLRFHYSHVSTSLEAQRTVGPTRSLAMLMGQLQIPFLCEEMLSTFLERAISPNRLLG